MEYTSEYLESVISRVVTIDEASEMLPNYCGVESVECAGRVLQYVNHGDTYGLTICQEGDGPLFVGSWGGWFEEAESEHEEDTFCESCGRNVCNGDEPNPDQMLWWSESLGRVELQIRREDVEACSGPGAADEPVAALIRADYMRAQLDKLDPALIRAALSEYGAWDDDELADDEASRERLVWCACCEVSEESRQPNERGDDENGEPYPPAIYPPIR